MDHNPEIRDRGFSPGVCEYSRKLGRFRKGLVHGFGQKLAIFQSFYYMQKRGRKMCLRIL